MNNNDSIGKNIAACLGWIVVILMSLGSMGVLIYVTIWMLGELEAPAGIYWCYGCGMGMMMLAKTLQSIMSTK